MRGKRIYPVLIGILALSAVAALALQPGETVVPSPSLDKEVAPTTQASGITCDFNCEDGFGFHFDCPDSTLGQCCSYGGPACASHGGLEDGICRQGRLGLPCVPLLF